MFFYFLNTSKIVENKHIRFRDVYVITTREKKRSHEFEEEWGEHVGGFKERKGKKKNNYIIISRF